jgi:hypothetical protein
VSRKKAPPRPAPAGRDENKPLTASELAKANALACEGGREASTVVREPADNVYGDLKVLMRIDGLYVVFDTKLTKTGSMGSGKVFWTEKGARNFAEAAVANKK